ncbi:MAG TPA: glycosyltransferase family 2 protein [Bauldia sp.]|nr:glycosyltransferase family 2 protein [Bauldia sp.]
MSEPAIPDASVCIATHRRPEGLGRLLRSLAEQVGAPSFEVIVVDNDAARSGEKTAREYGQRLRLTYVVEPVRGIARARNRSVAAAAGAYVAFIDDDEWATPGWLAELDRKARESGADAVIGPVTIVFEASVPAHVRAAAYFRRSDIGDGEPVPWHLTHTSNAYVRRSALPDARRPFDESFDLTGGEDSDLFRRMIKGGAKIVGATAAGVFEYRALRRANLRWLVRRALRNGANFAEMEWSEESLGRRLNLGRRAAWAALRFAAEGAFAWPRDKEKATEAFLRMGDRMGRFAGSLGLKIREYRVHP